MKEEKDNFPKTMIVYVRVIRADNWGGRLVLCTNKSSDSVFLRTFVIIFHGLEPPTHTFFISFGKYLESSKYVWCSSRRGRKQIPSFHEPPRRSVSDSSPMMEVGKMLIELFWPLFPGPVSI